MTLTSLDSIAAVNPLIRRDYTDDYRGSDVAAARQLELPPLERLNEAFAEIRARLAVPLDTLREIYTSVVDGKHILLYGPPGTGKTTLAEMIAATLFNCDFQSETAVSDWTPFETIGGLQLVTRDGRESLEPVPGVITRAVVECLNVIGRRELDGSGPQGLWLVLDELNRANTDAAFGQFFTALDQGHPRVSLAFFDEPRQYLTVPKRFRIVGTMNNFDKNFLFRLSYALTRRFALIQIDVPANDDTAARRDEEAALWRNVRDALEDRAGRHMTVDELMARYDVNLVRPLYDEFVTAIREQPGVSSPSRGLGRGIGFAQIADALRHAVLQVELGLLQPDETNLDALDRGVRSAIVPQLEGLSSTVLQDFLTWWRGQNTLRDMTRSIAAVGDLVRGAGLFQVE